jgi:hypothetical protein
MYFFALVKHQKRIFEWKVEEEAGTVKSDLINFADIPIGMKLKRMIEYSMSMNLLAHNLT